MSIDKEDIKGIEKAIRDIEQQGIYCSVTKIELPNEFSSDLNRIADALERIAGVLHRSKE
jgi:hypothetical protein